MCMVAINVPNEVLLGLHETERNFGMYARQTLAINLYEKKKVSLGLCAQIAQMPKEDFVTLLGENGISIFAFDGKEEFEEELSNA